MSYINKNIFRSAFVALSAFAGLVLSSSHAYAWDWDRVQSLAYEVQDRTDDAYDLAANEARENNPDEEYALELLGQLSVDADKFVDALNDYPWMTSSYTNAQYAQLYQSFYRADTAMNYAHFSYRVDQAFNDVESAMERLRIEYNFRYRPAPGWAYLTYRDYWYYRLGHRHDRIRWGRYIHDRRARRPINRDRWRRDHRDHRPPVRPPVRPPRRDDGHHRPPVQPPRRDDGHHRPPVQPPRRDDGHHRPPVQPPRRDDGHHRPPVQPPRRDDGHRRPPVQPPRRDNPRPGRPGRGGGDHGGRPGRGGGRHG